MILSRRAARHIFTDLSVRLALTIVRRDLGLLCKSAWQALREMFQEVAYDPSALPGVVITVQSYGDRLNLHPHIHALASRGVWSSDGSFEPIPALDGPQLMLLFRHHVLQNLLACTRIGQATLDILDRFHHPGFSAYQEEGVAAGDSAARERLASTSSTHRFLSLGFITTATPTSLPTRLAPPRARTYRPLPRNGSPPWMPWPLSPLISLKKGFSSSGIAAITATRPADNAASDNKALPPSLPLRPLCPKPSRTTSAATADEPGHA